MKEYFYLLFQQITEGTTQNFDFNEIEADLLRGDNKIQNK